MTPATSPSVTDVWRRLSSRVELSVLPAVLFVVVLALVGARNPNFFGSFNVGNVLTQVVPLLLVATGQTLVIATAGIDLSVGSIVSLASVVSAVLFAPLGVLGAVLVAVVASTAAGVVNGWLVGRGLEPFLVTLATLSVVQGIAFTVLASPGGHVPDSFDQVAGYFGGGAIPVALPIAVVVIALGTVFLRRHQIGLDILSTGSDAEVAALSGVRTGRALLWAYGLSGLLGGLAGLFVNARTLGGDPLAGASFTLQAIAAVVLGGTAITGGRASILGSALGALSLGLLSNVLNFSNISSFYQEAVQGLVVIIAVGAPILLVRSVRRVRGQQLTRMLMRPASDR